MPLALTILQAKEILKKGFASFNQEIASESAKWQNSSVRYGKLNGVAEDGDHHTRPQDSLHQDKYDRDATHDILANVWSESIMERN
ncbi:hypothetical protein ACTXT7_006093 [Hymenolepis weldensis]